jgi:hypothetical protein
VDGYILFDPWNLVLLFTMAFLLGSTVILVCVSAFLSAMRVGLIALKMEEPQKSDEEIVEEFAYQAGTDGQAGVFFESGTFAEQAATDYDGKVLDGKNSTAVGEENAALKRLEDVISRATASVALKG